MLPIFPAFLLYKKVRHSLRRSFLGKANLHRQNYDYAVESLPKALPKRIWMYWDKEIEDAPPFVRYAIRTWEERNPGWTVTLLSDETIPQYVTLPSTGDARKVQAKSDVLRLELLARFGGVWVDATCCCVRPLDEWLVPAMQSGFFAFPDTYPGRVICSWFLAASEGNYLVTRWRDLSSRYYAKGGKLGHYFWVMYLFELLVRTDRKAASIWKHTPHYSPKGPSLLKRIISEPKYAEMLPDNVEERAIPVLKISSSTSSDDRLFQAALQDGTDIPLREMVIHLLKTNDAGA